MFDLNAELTTKEILKRVGELGKIPQATIQGPGQLANRNSGSRSSAPVVARIESDPASYQAESSVRHVGGNNGELGPPQPSYAGHPNASTDSHGSDRSPNRYRDNRSSQFQRPGVGVTGAS